MKNLLVAQSGGPSAAINATITGVIDARADYKGTILCICKMYGT